MTNLHEQLPVLLNGLVCIFCLLLLLRLDGYVEIDADLLVLEVVV